MNHNMYIPQDLIIAAQEHAQAFNECRIEREKIAVEEFGISKGKCQTKPITWQQIIRSFARAALVFHKKGIHMDELSDICFDDLIKSARYFISFEEKT